jgi:hypothetical protein
VVLVRASPFGVSGGGKTKTPERDDFVFYKVEGTAPNRQLIIQWNNYGIYQSVLVRASPFGVSGGGVLWLVRGEPG